MTAAHLPLFPNHRLLNRHRAALKRQPNLNKYAPHIAQRLMFVGLLDHLARLPPLLIVDERIGDELRSLVDNILGATSKPLSATPEDIEEWWDLDEEDAGVPYSFNLVLYLSAMVDLCAVEKGPIHPVTGILHMMRFVLQPTVVWLKWNGLSEICLTAGNLEFLGCFGEVHVPVNLKLTPTSK